ncbi:Gfo/Idh/MocA family protein [Fuerstiella marisgermanici]|uniref:Inositol 2-dehydrogenase n=1 Tax=Fuerstiella marisgermanici TaxID=1891926 RepID=A0A1P8W8T8_9PLAN|nr:Gfo/Idh/MocA family oxidoreductase [Fuerstiella marisgermanici]APZ90458.1 Inositol 2-dehydrogenase [Fuerstiella marisgermanici]
MTNKSTRRSFLGTSAALGTAFWVAPKSFCRPTRSALQGLTAACIGVGGKGDSDSSHIANQDVEIVGICDVDRRTLEKKGKEFKNAKQFTDFRELFDSLGDKFDIVSVSTPDHTHAAAAVKAMRMKKHVYVQKPMTWSISEARLMRETAAETGVVTQMGNQGTAENGLREAVEVVRSGAIGDVTELHVWTNRPVWPQGIGRPEGSDPIPEHLDWESWLGPAPMRPYKEGIYHTFKWRGWVDFGTGALGDMACHTTNMPVKALELWDPVAVTAVKNPGIVEGETFPGSSTLMFEFPERNGLKPCKFYWYDGGNLPSDDLLAKLPAGFREKIDAHKAGGRKTSAAVLVGSKGLLLSENDYGAEYTLLPEEDYKGYKKPEATLPRIPFRGSNDERHKWEFVESCRGDYEPGTMSNFDYAGRLTETILVGNLAVRAGEGQRIEWDAKNMKSTNRPELNKFVGREYRDGWQI